MNKEIVAVTLLVLMSFAAAFAPLPLVFGQGSNLGVTIVQVTPSSLTGPVGTPVNVQGTLYDANSSYQILFDNIVVASGNTYPEGYYVNANFTVPQVPAGVYALILTDIAINTNSTSDSFNVTTSYRINATPSEVQEGGSVALSVGISGGVPNTAYSANVSVLLPSPLNTEFSKIVSLGTPNQQGTVNAQITYPDSSFQPNGSLTDYAGVYTVYFNQSQSLALSQFTVGFLDSTTYHRGQTVTVEATGYQPSQAVTFAVTSASSGPTLVSQSLTASANGVINTTWVVPSNVAIGGYTANITAQGTQKLIPDSETFSVPGYPIQVQTVNLAGDSVSGIQIQALDEGSTIIYNSTSGANGVANFNLETGAQVLTAFMQGVKVGETTITVTANGTFSLQCQLADLKITVQNENGILIPFVNLAITYQYQPTSGGSSQTGNASGQTDPSGTFTFDSVLTGISYTINASLYNQVFNSGNNTINNLPSQALLEEVITCPNETLTLNVVGNNLAAIPGARIDLVELTSGLFYSAITDSSGSATSQVTFGKYQVQIYQNNILINETSIDAFSDGQTQILCTLYDIQVSVSVVDFFGQPIPNANVTLNGPQTERFSAATRSDGTATFSNVVGGDMQVVAFAPGSRSDYQALTLIVDQPTSVQIRFDKYVAFGSLLIQVSSLITILIILVAIILLAVVELYIRRRAKHTSES